jgi:purine-binding chemotaxis protein CheW
MSDASSSYLTALVDTVNVAIPLASVQEVLLLPHVVAVPRVAPYVRGVINIRGSILPLIDLRVILGMHSFEEQLCALDKTLQVRTEDHKRWLAELEASIKEKRPFKLARNPHMCAFGKWYDTYKPQNDTITFQQYWRSFDEPHQTIHGIADIALDLAARGEYDQAMAVIDKTRQGVLSSMLGLFSRGGEMMRQTSRELAVVLKSANQSIAVSADGVQAVMDIPASDVDPLPQGQLSAQTKLITKTAKLTGTSKLCMLLEVEPLFATLAA